MYIKCLGLTRTKCPITMCKIIKNDFFENFGPLIKHDPHWINFIIFTFINEKNGYSRCLYKIWSKLISFDTRKQKKGNLKHIISFMKKKVNLGVLGMSPYVSNGVPQPCLDPIHYNLQPRW
jgi:hypothetical protein